jgi:oxygen-independent coproporphyrinogen-3 oxidase
MFEKLNPHNISLYIHFPWCIKKCPYCDFNSYQANLVIPQDAYLTALLADFDLSLQLFPNPQNLNLTSIFFGGGTPSLMSGKTVATILNHINQKLTFTDNLEITLEANPGAIEQDNMLAYKSAGINRISLGAQSFNDQQLQKLGRIHQAQDVKTTISNIINTNFASFNIDLMYGLPNQSIAEAELDLATALQFNPPHLSWYQLTMEPNTLFYRKPPPTPSEDILWEIYSNGLNLLQKNNFVNYEVSAFARDNYYCQHNLNYWQYGDYLGIGPGAHGKLTINQQIYRLIKTKHPSKYLSNGKNSDLNIQNNIMQQEYISDSKQIIFEFMLNNLRLNSGFLKQDFEQQTGVTIDAIQPILDQAIAKDLLIIQQDLIKPSSLGRRFLNDLQGMFL